MNRLESRLNKLQNFISGSINDDTQIRSPMSNTERAARVIYLLSHPDKCDPKTLARVTEILSKHLPLKGDKNCDLVDHIQGARVSRVAKHGTNGTDQG